MLGTTGIPCPTAAVLFDSSVLAHQRHQHLGEAIVVGIIGNQIQDDGEQPGGTTEGIEGHAFGLSQREMQEMAASLKPGYSAGFLLVEHVWARDLKGAIRNAGGFPLGEGFLTPEALSEVAIELVAMSEAIEELEAEETSAGT